MRLSFCLNVAHDQTKEKENERKKKQNKIQKQTKTKSEREIKHVKFCQKFKSNTSKLIINWSRNSERSLPA